MQRKNPLRLGIRLPVAIHSQSYFPFIESPVAGLLLNHEECRGLPAPCISPRPLSCIQSLQEAKSQLAFCALESPCHRLDCFLTDQNVALRGIAPAGHSPGPVMALLT